MIAMDEHFLHYIWKYQKFNISPLFLTNGQSLRVFYPGNYNEDSGPDFEEARIKIDNIEWAGQVEIHIKSSDWYNHQHEKNTAYNNVILHVVWKHDKEVTIHDQAIPTLELNGIVNPLLIDKYQKHTQVKEEILCGYQLQSIGSITLNSMLDRVLVERLEEKANRIKSLLASCKNDWEEITYRSIAANFGFSTNKEAFTRLSQILPHKVLRKVLHQQKQTEALLFGMAGFLENPQDEYQSELRTEFEFLQKKYELNDPMVTAQWKFGKMRPANFPTVRIAQFACLLHTHPQLFAVLIETDNIKTLKKKIRTPVGDYWQSHYDFNKINKRKTEMIGITSFENLLINTVAPLLAAYSSYTANQVYMDRAIALLESLSPESNRVTRKWETQNIEIKNAFESQAFIHLFKHYCQKRKCLQCNVGVELLNK